MLSSYDVLGGPQSSSLLFATAKFRSENPKTYRAFISALGEAIDWINANKNGAAETYIRAENSKLELSFIRGILNDPDIQFKLTPERIEVFSNFLHKIGALKTKPASWRDVFFEDVSYLPGS